MSYADVAQPHPDSINTRLVLRLYAWLATVAGLTPYGWPPAWVKTLPTIDGAAWSPYAMFRIEAAVIVAAGLCAWALTVIDDPIARQRALIRFAIAHLVFGFLRFLQWHAILKAALPDISTALPAILGGLAPLVLGALLLYIGVTATRATPLRTIVTGGLFASQDADREHHAEPDWRLRSQYAEQIRRAARQEERARLARDLHDAVKQQLFVIQTAAATVQARFDADRDGARESVGHIRAAAHEAAVEMQSLIEELQAAPLENVGLAAALKKQCEALGFRTGSIVNLAVAELPPSDALRPGAHEAIFRVAQEALANIGRHARATHVDVGLKTVGERLELSVSDDGSGFDTRAAAQGLGLKNMSARARELGGLFNVRSIPGTGTFVNFSVPFEHLSASSYGLRALWWACFLGIVAFTWHKYDPISLIVAGITALIAGRYLVAFLKIRRWRIAA